MCSWLATWTLSRSGAYTDTSEYCGPNHLQGDSCDVPCSSQACLDRTPAKYSTLIEAIYAGEGRFEAAAGRFETSTAASLRVVICRY